MSTFQSNTVPIQKLYNSISKWVDKDVHDKYFKEICEEYDSKWKKDLDDNHWKNAKVRILLQVHERLELIKSLKVDISDEFTKRYKYPQLITYLSLTCFDQLGQPAEWKTFDNWLNSKKNIERDKIINDSKKSSSLELAKILYNQYLLIYGVKNSFYRFLNEVLSEDARKALLDTIDIWITFKNAKNYEGRDATDKDKVDYLFKVRNDFTHNTFSQSPIIGVSKPNKDGMFYRETFYKGNERIIVNSKSEFDEKISETVLIGIALIIKNG